jgi:hypothetical protein
MAPNTKTTSAKVVKPKTVKLSLTEKLAKKGYTPDNEEEGVVIEIDNKSYIVKMDGEKKIFEEYVDAELVIEKYDEPESGESSAEEEEEEKKEESEEDIPIVPVKEKKSPKAKKEKKDGEVKEKKPRKSKKTEEKKEEAEEEKAVEVDDDGKKKRKRRDPSKPKRHRDPTPYNQFISEKMNELKKLDPPLEEVKEGDEGKVKSKGRQFFKMAVEMWKNFDSDEKTAYVEKYRLEHPKTVVASA